MGLGKRKAQDHFPILMRRTVLFCGLKHEKKREKKNIFPILAEFLFSQLIDLNI